MKTDSADTPFHSLSKPVPPLRGSLHVYPARVENRQLICFYDALGYIPENYSVDKSIAGLLPLLDGNTTVPEIVTKINEYGGNVSEEELLRFIHTLDQNRILFSDYFKFWKNQFEESFEAAPIRKPVCVGTCYPESPEEIRILFDSELDALESGPTVSQAKAVFAPHIDPRVSLACYAKAFLPIRDAAPKQIILLGTSHYAGLHLDRYDLYPFILSKKDFETPLGVAKNSKKWANFFEAHKKKAGISLSDRAHRPEHSLELHLLFLQYFWKHEFEITPILVNSLEDILYMPDGAQGEYVAEMGRLLSVCNEDEDTMVLISGDLSHVGHKFGDSQKASDLFQEVRLFDGLFLEQAQLMHAEGLRKLLAETNDKYRICGFSPLYTWLNSNPETTAEITGYELWDEREQESAVSFGSILFR